MKSSSTQIIASFM